MSVCVAETCRVDFMRCLAEFSKQYPAIPVNTNVALLGLSEEYLVKSNFDVCFVAEKTINGSDLFDYVVTNQDRLCLVIPENYPAPDDLSDLSFPTDSVHRAEYIRNALLMENIQRVFLTRNYVPHYGTRAPYAGRSRRSTPDGIFYPAFRSCSITRGNTSDVCCSGRRNSVNCVAAGERQDNRSADFFIRVIKEIREQLPGRPRGQ